MAKLSFVLQQNPAMIILTDPQGIIEYVNPKFTEVTGYELNEISGQTMNILKSPNTPDELYNDLWSTILAGREWQGELQNTKKNGEQYWEHLKITPIKDHSGKIHYFVAALEDITEKKISNNSLITSKTMIHLQV